MHPLKISSFPGRPLLRSDEDSQSNRISTARTRQKPQDSKLVLLVEDNPLNQQFAAYQLNLLGYATAIASNGQQALDALSASRYVAILMDCQMPVMDGFEASRRIRAMEHLNNSHIPIIAMTANDMPGDRERCLKAGMDGYIAKPLSRSRLANALAQQSAPPVETLAAAADVLSMLNMQRLEDLFGDDAAMRHRMLDLFITSSVALFGDLKKAIDRSNFPATQACLHRLLGACGNLGADQLSELTRSAQLACRAGDIHQLHRLNDALLSAFSRFSAHVEKNKDSK